jgi:hypothetical protein
MKTQIRAALVSGAFLFTLLTVIASHGQVINDREVPGDHFSLEGALELFKKSSSPQEFERLLNVPDGKVNNLDLNGDGLTDYIRVIDRYDANVHAFILQAVVSPTQSQDIAVIELEQLGNGRASLQIVGDPDIYGVETIIEPTEDVRMYAGTQTSRAPVNVWVWPIVQYCYDPYYSVWISPWGWYSRPVWWSPWRPVSYVVYRPYWDPYRNYYSYCHFHRNTYARRVYVPVRTTSVIVYERHRDVIVHARNTRGRDYDRDGYHRDGDRNRNERQVSNMRDNGSSRRSYQERDGERDNNNYNSSRSAGRTRTTVQGTEDVRNENNYNSGRTRSSDAPAPRIRTQTNDTQPVFTPRPNNNGNRERTQATVNRTSTPERKVSAPSSPQRNQSVQRPSGGSVSRPQKSQAAPRSVSPPSGGQRREAVSPGGSSSQGSGGKKRGRE